MNNSTLSNITESKFDVNFSGAQRSWIAYKIAYSVFLRNEISDRIEPGSIVHLPGFESRRTID